MKTLVTGLQLSMAEDRNAALVHNFPDHRRYRGDFGIWWNCWNRSGNREDPVLCFPGDLADRVPCRPPRSMIAAPAV